MLAELSTIDRSYKTLISGHVANTMFIIRLLHLCAVMPHQLNTPLVTLFHFFSDCIEIASYVFSFEIKTFLKLGMGGVGEFLLL